MACPRGFGKIKGISSSSSMEPHLLQKWRSIHVGGLKKSKWINKYTKEKINKYQLINIKTKGLQSWRKCFFKRFQVPQHILWRMWTYDDKFSFLSFNLNKILKNSTPGKVTCIWHIERVQIDVIKSERTQIHFFSEVFTTFVVVVGPYYLTQGNTLALGKQNKGADWLNIYLYYQPIFLYISPYLLALLFSGRDSNLIRRNRKGWCPPCDKLCFILQRKIYIMESGYQKKGSKNKYLWKIQHNYV